MHSNNIVYFSPTYWTFSFLPLQLIGTLQTCTHVSTPEKEVGDNMLQECLQKFETALIICIINIHTCKKPSQLSSHCKCSSYLSYQLCHVTSFPVTASASAYPCNSLLISLVQTFLDKVAPCVLSYYI